MRCVCVGKYLSLRGLYNFQTTWTFNLICVIVFYKMELDEGYYVAESSSLNNFYKLAMDKSSSRCADVNNNICYGANQFAKLRELFREFRKKHNNFNYCVPEHGYDHGQYVILTCWPIDGSKGNLRSSVTQNGEKLAMSIEENENSVFEGLSCTSTANQEMHCKGTGALSSYSL